MNDSRHIPAGTIVHREIPYVENGHPRQKLDLYLPSGHTRLPVVVVVHGGGYHQGSKEGEDPSLYLEQGYAVASLNYRFSQHAIWPAQIEDCKAAVRWLRAHSEKYGLDPERVAAYGPSAGGHLAAMLGVTGSITGLDVGENLECSSAVQAVVDFYGPTDFLQIDEHGAPNGQRYNSEDSVLSRLIGGAIQQNKSKTATANPIGYVTHGAPPFLIVHGDSDLVVPLHQSQLLASALKSAGVPVTFLTVKGGGHEEFTERGVFEVIKEFLGRHLER